MNRGPRTITRQWKQEPTLSLCMIVKNEAATLERCLETARPHVDEIVIVDTGSSDGTQDIARRYADVFDEIEWPDSFSEARNHSLSLAAGDFLMYLDGDEYIEQEEHWRRIREVIRDAKVAGAEIYIRNQLSDKQILAGDRSSQPRIFRNHPQIQFQGRVHNQVLPSILRFNRAAGTRLVTVEAEAMHTGYALDEEQARRKYTPRLHLLQAEVRDGETAAHRAYYAFQLGVAYFTLREYEKALATFQAVDDAVLRDDNAFYVHLLAAQCGLKLGKPVAALHHSEHMLRLNRREPIAYHTTGVSLIANRRFGDGLLLLSEAFNRSEEEAAARYVLNVEFIVRALASACEKIGLRRNAEAFRALLVDSDVDLEALRALVGVLQHSVASLSRDAA